MIILHKKFYSVFSFFSLIYFIIILCLVSLFTRSITNWYANVTSDIMYICQIAPIFLLGSFFIDNSFTKPYIIRISRRSRALFLLLLQQYLFALFFLLLWIITIILFSTYHLNGISDLNIHQLTELFFRNYLVFLTMIHLSTLLKRANILGGPAFAYIVVYVLSIIEILALPKIRQVLHFKLSLIFSWIYFENFFFAIVILLLINCILLLFSIKAYREYDIL